jgi:hypothetical protein
VQIVNFASDYPDFTALSIAAINFISVVVLARRARLFRSGIVIPGGTTDDATSEFVTEFVNSDGTDEVSPFDSKYEGAVGRATGGACCQ